MKEQEIKDFISREIEYQLKSIDNLQNKDVATLLKNYNKYKNTIKYLEDTLLALENGTYVFMKNSDVSENIQHSLSISDPLVKIEDKIASVNKKLSNYRYVIFKLDSAFSIISSDNYYNLIKKRYIESKCVADILYELNISYTTYKSHHKRLINEIKSLFKINF